MESTISRFYAGMKPAKACNPFLPGFVTIDWTAALFYIFTGFIGFKAKALEKTADAVCSGVFLFVSDTNAGLSRRMSSRMSRRDGSADAPLCSFRSPSSS